VNFRHFTILAAWTVIALTATGALVFLFTFGDCFDSEVCKRTTNRNFTVIAGGAFVVYWAVFIALVRKWNR